eukprot:SM000011S18984  [mRNA]  locus=s11:145682:148327:- [translate_table: standard]
MAALGVLPAVLPVLLLSLLLAATADYQPGAGGQVRRPVASAISRLAPRQKYSLQQSGFVRIHSGRRTMFSLKGKTHYAVGTNYWEGVWLAMEEDDGGNRTRLANDLDLLARLGFNKVRLLAATEGPDNSPYRPGFVNEAVFKGLDYILVQLRQTDMKATLVLNDFWHDTGGFAQYVNWVDPASGPIPYPPSYPTFTGNWTKFIEYSARFYNDNSISNQCQTLYQQHMRAIINRVNHITGLPYTQDPTIFSWELANEPQQPPQQWVDATGQYIKSLDPCHLVTAGMEGKEDDEGSLFIRVHSSPFIDYATIHLWVENWGVYKPSNDSIANLEAAVKYATKYLQQRAQYSRTTFQKPVILVMRLVKNDSMAGQLFWAWSGEGRPSNPGPRRLGDPPHEPPGWYSVYDKDNSTLEILSHYAKCTQEFLRQRKA